MMDLADLPPHRLVDLLADKVRRCDVIVALVGGITATELRAVRVSEAARRALIDGLKHPNSKVRWWCIQLMDHVADEGYLEHLLEAARTDATPKNRRHAVHAMACGTCKPQRRCLSLESSVLAALVEIACSDPDASVRDTARGELSERGVRLPSPS